MAGRKLVTLEGKYDTYKGSVVLIDPSAVLVTGKNGDGRPDLQAAGHLYPTLTGRLWEDSPAPRTGVIEEPELDFSEGLDLELEAKLREFARLQLFARAGMLAELCPGGVYHWRIYAEHFQLDPNDPCNCLCKQRVPPYGPQLHYEYYSAEVPIIESQTWTSPSGGCGGFSYEVDRVINKPPDAVCLNMSGCIQMDNMYAVVVEQLCPGGGGYVPLVPIEAPRAINLTDEVNYPTIVRGGGTPNLYAGTITNIGNQQTGYNVLTPEADGYTIDMYVPCPCTDGQDGEDGKTIHPVFKIRNVTHDDEKPLSVNLVEVAEDSYVFDFNIPGDEMQLEQLDLELPIYDAQSDSVKMRQVSIFGAGDGTNSEVGALALILEQILELRAKINPNVKQSFACSAETERG